MAAAETPAQQDQDGPIELTEAFVVETLTQGTIKEQGLLPYSSNHSFLITVKGDDIALPAVYKPRHGENPLWDFEWGSLCQRETAAYFVSHCLNWDLVPPTVLREGPRGIGSVQLYIANQEEEHYFTAQADARFAQAFRRLSLFDYVINNADRKSGHCLVGEDERIWAIDHGIAFHTEYKLRTVIWEYSHDAIEPEFLEDLTNFAAQLEDKDSTLNQVLCTLLTKPECHALQKRVCKLIQSGTYPSPLPHRRNYPWPPV